MAHGDDRGLRLPPSLAPYQVVVVPIYRSDEERSRVLQASAKVAEELSGAAVRVKVDDREGQRPGFKFNEWELKGVPIRLELGPRDLDAEQVTVVRRDTGDKETWPLSGLGDGVGRLLLQIQEGLHAQAKEFLEAHTFHPKDYEELRAVLADPGGFAVTAWCGRPECEDRVKADTKATIRYLSMEPGPVAGSCIVCGEPATEEAAWALAY